MTDSRTYFSEPPKLTPQTRSLGTQQIPSGFIFQVLMDMGAFLPGLTASAKTSFHCPSPYSVFKLLRVLLLPRFTLCPWFHFCGPVPKTFKNTENDVTTQNSSESGSIFWGCHSIDQHLEAIFRCSEFFRRPSLTRCEGLPLLSP
jgi:hypothetical protein